jgi:CRP-like cAMP-binding protein
MSNLHDLRDLAEQKLQTGDPIKALKVFRLVLEGAPRDFQTRLRIADCLLVMGETRLAGLVYAAVALYSMKAGLPLQALVALKMVVRTLPELRLLQRDLADMYNKDSPVMGRGARAAPVDLSAQVRDDLDLDYPMDQAELLETTAQMSAYTKNVEPPARRVPPIPLFSELGVDAFTAVIDALELRRLDDGQVVVRQGDPGDCFFVVAQGQVRIERSSVGSLPVVLARLGEGSVFGEMSVLANEPRSATVVVEGRTDLLLFSRQALAALERDLPQVGALLQRFATERMIRNLMSTNPIFQPFDQEQRMTLFKRFEAHKVQAGTTLVRQDEEGRGLYLVLYGEVEVIRTDPSGQRTSLATLGAGDCFGEISLCQRRPTTATVETRRDSTIMFLAREYFQKLIEAVPELSDYYLDLSVQRLLDSQSRLEARDQPVIDDELVRV